MIVMMMVMMVMMMMMVMTMDDNGDGDDDGDDSHAGFDYWRTSRALIFSREQSSIQRCRIE